MTTSNLEQVYRHGLVAVDLAAVKPNTVILRGIPAPESVGIIALPAQSSVKGARCLFFRVEAVGAMLPERWAPGDSAFGTIKVGALVVPRHGNLDPIGTDDNPLFALDVCDVFAVVDDACAEMPVPEAITMGAVRLGAGAIETSDPVQPAPV